MSSDLLLVIGNRNYSSWSLRPWILLRHLGLAFRELVLPLDTPAFHHEIAHQSPTHRVPVLRDGDLSIWESIAICEYAIEKAGGRGWPRNPGARAVARAVAAEMHAGFGALRSAFPMNIRARHRQVPLTPEITADISRIDALWTACRATYGADGPWLFGAEYSAADAMFAPVVMRFNTYGATGLGPVSLTYLQSVLADAALQDWMRQAAAEPATLAATDAVGQ